jgi:predicted acyl esterase
LASSVPASGQAAQALEPFEYTWEESYFPSGDGTQLHADILRDPDVAPTVKQPVILTVSPYLNHASEAPPEYGPFRSGPSHRFFDFLERGRVLERGYTYAMVDLRGFGGSGGCTDWGGPGEQADVKAAVEWAGSQPWSNGRVGVFGKSYDGWTGLMAIANRPEHLAAVVAMEPVYDGYRYLYTNGVRFTNSVATPAIFVADDAMPGGTKDSPEYLLNGTSPNAACYALDVLGQQSDDGESDFWQARELIRKSRGAATPLLLTQGFLESNTMPDGAFAFFSGMTGPKQAWFGQFDHVRGYEKSGNEFAVGRDGFLGQAIRFFDRYVKGLPASHAPVGGDPAVVVQGIDGRYRAETAWPPADASMLRTTLRVGSYPDDGNNVGDGGGDDPRKLWSISSQLLFPAHLAGEPVFEATVATTLPRANLVANVYDIDPAGGALMISRGTMLLRNAGRSTVTIPMYGQDWPIPAGHRIGVALSGANSEWWLHIPTNFDVQVESASISLPFLRFARTKHLDGKAGPRLSDFYQGSFSISPDTISEASTSFALPPRLEASAAGSPPAGAPTSGGPASPHPSGPKAGALPATGLPTGMLGAWGVIFTALAMVGSRVLTQKI